MQLAVHGCRLTLGGALVHLPALLQASHHVYLYPFSRRVESYGTGAFVAILGQVKLSVCNGGYVLTMSDFPGRYFATSSKAAELHVTVNGRAVAVPEGSTLFDATSKLGAFVPTLCKHPRLPNTPGACRYTWSLRTATLQAVAVHEQ